MRLIQILVAGLNRSASLLTGVSGVVLDSYRPQAKPTAHEVVLLSLAILVAREAFAHRKDPDFLECSLSDVMGATFDLRLAFVLSLALILTGLPLATHIALQPLRSRPVTPYVQRIFPALRVPDGGSHGRKKGRGYKVVRRPPSKKLDALVDQANDGFWVSDGTDRQEALVPSVGKQTPQIAKPRAEELTEEKTDLWGRVFPESCAVTSPVCKDGRVATGFSEAHHDRLPR